MKYNCFVAKVYLFASQKGGRKSNIKSGIYRPNLVFGYEGLIEDLFDGQVYKFDEPINDKLRKTVNRDAKLFFTNESRLPGSTFSCLLGFSSIDANLIKAILKFDQLFLLREGFKVVGCGSIQKNLGEIDPRFM